jgi:RNA polymerase sigma factor (sigma-70 family)
MKMTIGADVLKLPNNIDRDDQVLRQYLVSGDQEAFTRLMRRHLNLVYAAALRQVREPSLAEDITQAVFIVLHQKAAQLRAMPTLAGWLLTVTRYAAMDAMRKQLRLKHRERSAAKSEVIADQAVDDWDRLEPVLDAALAKLDARERDAIVLRFEDKSFAQIGQTLGISEDAAGKRVARGFAAIAILTGGGGALVMTQLLAQDKPQAAQPAAASTQPIGAAQTNANPPGGSSMSAAETVLQLLETKDSFQAIAFLTQGNDPAAVMKQFNDVTMDLYWKHKNLFAVICIARAGTQYALAHAAELDATDASQAMDLRLSAKILCYNLASFTWQGWDEPGIMIDASERMVGLDAAKTNLRLAQALKRGDLPLSRDYWMLASHELTAGRRDEAVGLYGESARLAAAANSRSEELLAIAFTRMVDLLSHPQNADAIVALDAIKSQLQAETDGPEYVRQVETALRVFGPSKHGNP